MMESDSNSNDHKRNEGKLSSAKRTQEVPAGEKRTLGEILIGPARNVRDPEVFHRISLLAFLAWVGLGSASLSSSCYGPEEAFLAMEPHQYLSVFLAMLMALTVFIISASYMQTIEQL